METDDKTKTEDNALEAGGDSVETVVMREKIKTVLGAEGTLTDRGTGAYLAPKHKAYTSQKSELIPQKVIDELEKSGFLKSELPFLSVKYSLA